MIKSIPLEKFKSFHKKFKGDFFDICAICGGKCEYNKIGTLLPGEKEFIAKSIKKPLSILEDEYLDKLITPLGDVDVLKFVYSCPFLDNQFRCTIKNVKVVTCDIYPILLFDDNGSVGFRIDADCLLSKDEKIRRYFLEIGIKCLKEPDIPVEWIKIIEQYDRYDFDYKEIEKMRKDRKKCETFYLENINRFRIIKRS